MRTRGTAVVVIAALIGLAGAARAQGLSIRKTADRPTAAVGDVVRYEVTVDNQGDTDLTGVHLRDTPPSGLDYADGTAMARLRTAAGTRTLRAGTGGFDDQRDGQGLIFGPFDLPAGSRIRIYYQLTVGTGAARREVVNRAVMVDAGGSGPLSEEASATVRIVAGDDLDLALIVGTVYCDADGDQVRDAGEGGLFGARIYLDTGSFAITDSAGLYHFSQLEPGTHLVKIDDHSLAGGVSVGAQTRLLRLTDGMPARADYPVACARVEVSSGDPPAAGAADAAAGPYLLEGSAAAPSLSVNGQPQPLPSAGLALEIPAALRLGERNLAPVPDSGYGDRPVFRPSFALQDGAQPARWQLVLRDQNARVVRTLGGAGAPPQAIPWDGLDASGAPAQPGLLGAQLTVIGDRGGMEASSARLPVGIAYGQARTEARVQSGELVAGGGEALEATAILERQVAIWADLARGASAVEIEVHGDGADESLAAVARTQQQAELLARLLGEAGVDPAIVSARGRGGLDPIEPPDTAAGRAANRRVVLTVRHEPQTEAVVPERIEGQADALVAGRSVPLSGAGDRFQVEVESLPVVVDLQASDGRRVARTIGAPHPTSPRKRGEEPGGYPTGSRGEEPGGYGSGGEEGGGYPAVPEPRPIRIRGSIARGFRAAGAALPAELLALEIRRRGDAPVAIEDGRPRVPVELELAIPPALAVAGWRVVVTPAGGTPVEIAAGTGAAPPLVRWTGGEQALAPGRHELRLEVTTLEGHRGSSAAVSLQVGGEAADTWSRFDLAGRLFTGRGTATAGLKNRLSRFASEVAKRPADERYRITVTVASPGGSAVEGELAAAARSAWVADYLERLGLAEARLEVTGVAGARDSITFAAVNQVRSAPLASPAIRIDGIVRALDPAGLDAAVEVAPGGAVTVDVTTPEGQRAVWIVRAPEPAVLDAPRAGAEPPTAPPAAPAVALTAVLPPRETSLRSRYLPVTGRTAGARVRITAGDRLVEVVPDRDGAFAAIVEIPIGATAIAIEAEDRAGARSRIDWPVRVTEQSLFVLALAEGIAGTARAGGDWGSDLDLAGMTERSATSLGPLRLHGRARIYAVARDDDVWGRPLAATVHLDTGKPGQAGAFFEDLVDPQRDLPVWGDSATEVRDANTRGPLYMRLELGDSRAVIGSMHTALEPGYLFRYDRTLDGALIDVREQAGEHELAARGFAATGAERLSRGIDRYRATGGSLYYLRNGQVIEGSEVLRVEIRDRESGMVVESRALARNVDYTIDYPGGRILLVQPVGSTAASSWLIESGDAAVAPVTGNPVYLEVRYEHADPDGASDGAAGLHVSDHHADLGVGVGAGIVTERRGDADYTLWGASARLGDEAAGAVLEYAGSRRDAGGDFFSPDGGLTFLALPGGQDGGAAHAFRATVHAGGQGSLEDLRAQGYVQHIDLGFSSDAAALENGRTKVGGVLAWRINQRDRLAVRHDTAIADVPVLGPTAADVTGALELRTSYRTALQWARDDGIWHHRVEGLHHGISTTAKLASGAPLIDAQRVGVAAGTGYDVTDRLRLRLAQQVIASLADDDPRLETAGRRDGDPLAGFATGVGVDVALTPDLEVGADLRQRWNGDNAAEIGARTRLSDAGHVYLRQRAGLVAGDPETVTIIGAEDRIEGTAGGRSYGEYRLENGIAGPRARAVLGLGHRWQVVPGVRVGLGFEHQQVLAGILPDGTALGGMSRDLLRAAAEYTRPDRLLVTGLLELRVDDGPGGAAVDLDLVREDPRDAVDPATFADHGGVAPGAPLWLAPGDRVQMVAAGGLAARMAAAHTALGRARYSRTETEDAGIEFTEARFLELTAGWAYRPPDNERVTILWRYSFLLDLRPVAEPTGRGADASAVWTDARSHVVAIIPLFDLPGRLTVGGKLAVKRTEAALRLEDATEAETGTTALLWLLRPGYRFHGNWDASVEARQLFLDRQDGSELRTGMLLEIGYRAGRLIRIGAGYDFGHFSDDELGDLERDRHGLFVRATGHY